MSKQSKFRVFVLIAAVAAAFCIAADTVPRALNIADALTWKSPSTLRLSDDGVWAAYRMTPGEGDSEVMVRNLKDGKETKFAGGQTSGFGMDDMAFSHDGKWFAFKQFPAMAEARKAKKERRPAFDKVILVELATGKKTEYEKIRRFSFSGENSGWLALHKAPADGAAAAPAAMPPAATPPAAGGAAPAATARPTGTDLVLVELATTDEQNVGNVAEFAFNKAGDHLAFVIDAADKSGNGVQLRTMADAATRVLESGKANYKSLRWSDKGDALAVLKGSEDKDYEDKLYAVIGWTGFGGTLQKTVYDPKSDTAFPSGMTISGNRAPSWTLDKSALVFGIAEAKKKKDTAKDDGKKDESKAEEAKKAAPKQDEPEKADLVIWHVNDRRLPSMQQVQEQMDKNFSYLSVYRPAEKKFLRLADESVRDVTLPEPHQFALGTDTRAYERMGNLDGQRKRDVYVIDPKTGEKKLALQAYRWMTNPAPDGKHFAYYEDGHFFTYEIETGKTYKITDKINTTFWDTEDDHNVVKPPAQIIGWAVDGQSLWISDTWDIWQTPVHGGKALNLTANGKKDKLRYRMRIGLDPEEKGITTTKPQYVMVSGELSKRIGIARITPGKAAPEMLLWEDAAVTGLQKAKDAEVFAYRRGTAVDPPEVFIAGPALDKGSKITDVAAQKADKLWSAGSRLIEYTSAKGDKLQAALYLPANYEPGKKYPTLVYIYEKLTQGYYQFEAPSLNALNKSIYASNGYAVLTPDITYKLNDPGMSAVWCVVPAVEAAIKTGIVDEKRVGIHGHSWGGYQTAFLITQTNIFRAAIAGAPLTNMISMYSSIYWNSGSANQPIFESSQGRFTGGYWDQTEAYIRNSPVFHARNVQTPLMILHNDKDGAVDHTQGIEYFNTLRRLNKSVVMLEYKGENHGLAQARNRKDYQIRMKEFFDHHLMDKPAPKWLSDGVSHLELKDHLEERAKEIESMTKPPAPKAPPKDAKEAKPVTSPSPAQAQ